MRILLIACLCGLLYLSWSYYVSWTEDRELLKQLMNQAKEIKQKNKSMEKEIQSLKMQLRKCGEQKLFVEKKIQYMKVTFREMESRMTTFLDKVLEEIGFEEDSSATFSFKD